MSQNIPKRTQFTVEEILHKLAFKDGSESVSEATQFSRKQIIACYIVCIYTRFGTDFRKNTKATGYQVRLPSLCSGCGPVVYRGTGRCGPRWVKCKCLISFYGGLLYSARGISVLLGSSNGRLPLRKAHSSDGLDELTNCRVLNSENCFFNCILKSIVFTLG